MRIVADETGWELLSEAEAPLRVDVGQSELAPSMPPVSSTVSTSAPGSGVFRKVAEEDEATMPTDPAPASGEGDDVRLPAPARLPPDLTGDKTRVA